MLPHEAFEQPTDGAVPVASALGGAAGSATALAFVDTGKEVSHLGGFAQAHGARAIVDALQFDEPSGFRPVDDLQLGDRPAR